MTAAGATLDAEGWGTADALAGGGVANTGTGVALVEAAGARACDPLQAFGASKIEMANTTLFFMEDPSKLFRIVLAAVPIMTGPYARICSAQAGGTGLASHIAPFLAITDGTRTAICIGFALLGALSTGVAGGAIETCPAVIIAFTGTAHGVGVSD